MWSIVIDIQEGFSEDDIIVKINGDIKFRDQNVTSSLLAGPTRSFETEVREGEVTVEVFILTKRIQGSTTVTVDRQLYFGISVIDTESLEKRIRFLIQEEPFGYL